MRLALFAAAAAMALAFNAASQATKNNVNVGDIDAMARLAKTDPHTYERVRGLLREVGQRPARYAQAWAKEKYGAEQLECSGVMRLSEPPKYSISFMLGDTRFSGTYDLTQLDR